MTVQSNPAANQFQRIANDISARLAQLAKDPPDLLAYLRVHADCLRATLHPAGFAYEMQNGQVFQRVLLSNLESLNYRGFPEQEGSFQRALRMAAQKRQAVFIPPNTLPSAGLQGLSVEDSPAPDELPIFNRTEFEQVFVPILLSQAAVGVLHIWFAPGDQALAQARVALLKQVCGEIELYLKARRLSDISQEVTRLTTYSRLLEELSGDLDLDSVSWNIVNFARETVACDRVCLFIAKDYDKNTDDSAVMHGLDHEFELFACSGLKRPNPRSEQAVVLQRVAQKLTQMSLTLPARPGGTPALAAPSSDAAPLAVNGRIEGPGGGATPAAIAVTETAPANATEQPAAAPAKKPTEPRARPRTQMTLMARDPSKVDKRPPEVNDYFDIMPMNWATVLPLFDRDNRVCGIVLFEGVKSAENLGASFSQMRDLAISAGRALGTSLYWNRQPSLRLAQRWVHARQEFINTPARRKWARYGLPTLTLAALLAFPLPYKIKGDATILPVRRNSLPVMVGTRLLDVQVREGETVKQDQALARLDTRDLEMQLRQAEQEFERSLVESETAMSLGNEAQMQLSRLAAAKARTTAEKLRADIAHATFKAPFDGIVLGAQTLSTRLGEVLRLGEPVLEVIDPTQWQVKVNFREQDIIYLGRHLAETGRPIPVSLTLAANPAHHYDIELQTPAQIAYGLDTTRGKYEFVAMLPLATDPEDARLLKSGFAGRATFTTARRPIAYILFKDFVNFLRVRFL